VLSAVDRRPSPIDYTQRPALCTAQWPTELESVFQWTICIFSGPSASAEIYCLGEQCSVCCVDHSCHRRSTDSDVLAVRQPT